MSVPKKDTLKQIMFMRMPHLKLLPLETKDFLECAKMWLQQKDTDDFGGEMTASEFKRELMREIE